MTAAPRSLWPREHGAYVQLAAPLVAALVTRPPTLAAALIALGASLAFGAHESLLVVLGHRGRRMRELAGARARVVLALAGSAAALAGVVGLVLAPPLARAIAAAVAAPVAALLVLAWRRRERTIPGEVVAAIGLAGAGAVVAAASGAGAREALLVWAGWSLGFATTVVAVHRVLARHKRPAQPIDRVLAVALVAVAGVTAVAPPLAIAAPLAAASLVLVVAPPRATRMVAVGVALSIACAASIAWLLAAG